MVFGTALSKQLPSIRTKRAMEALLANPRVKLRYKTT